MRQVWMGRDTAAAVQQGTTKLAETLKAPPEMANHIGLSVDLGVSFGIAGMVKAVRVGSVTLGRINLMQHEAKTPKGPGGHTLLKHVGQTEAQLRARLAKESDRTLVSSFKNMHVAEFAISAVMRANSVKIKSWALVPPKRGRTLVIGGYVAGDIGYGLARATGRLVKLDNVKIILKYEFYNGLAYYVLTSCVE